MFGKTTRREYIVLAGVITLLACKLARSENDWPQSRHNPQNTASIRLSGKDICTPRSWTLGLKRHVWGYQPGMAVWSSAAVGLVDGRAVIAVGAYDRNIYLLDACSGKRVWKFTTGGGVYQAPVIWRYRNQTRIFSTSSDRLVYSLDASTGRRIWSIAVQKYRPTLGGARLSSPSMGKVKDVPAVFVGWWVFDKSLKNNLQQGGVTALAALDGKRLWQTDFLDNQVSAPLYVNTSKKNMLFVASRDGNLRALDADTGALLWHHREIEPIMGSPAWMQTPEGPRVIMGSHFGKIRCLDAETGQEKWSFKTGNWITGSPVVYKTEGRQMIAVGSYDQRIYGLDAKTGEKIWSHPTGGPVYSSATVVDQSEPIVLASSLDNHLYGVSGLDGTLLFTVYTGSPLWDATIMGDNPWSSPVTAWVADRWMIYQGSYNGTFYAIELNQAPQAGSSKPWSNTKFWITMLLVLCLTTAVALYLGRKK